MGYCLIRCQRTDVSLQRQQAGRAGRRSKDSLVVLVAESFAVDQYYANHPEELFDGKLDELMVDVDSKVVLEGASMFSVRFLTFLTIYSTSTMCWI